MHRKYITQPHKQLLCPPMFYFDKCHITNGSSRFWLEPATMTSSLFTEVTRRHSDAHRVLGFIHQVLKSSAENSKQDTNANVQNYHRQLAVLFRGLRQVQQGLDKRLQGVEITIYDDVEGDVTFTADIIVPINLFIADTPPPTCCVGIMTITTRAYSVTITCARPDLRTSLIGQMSVLLLTQRLSLTSKRRVALVNKRLIR
jgi:hypothetical protein